MALEVVKVGARILRPHKAQRDPSFEMRNVLTIDPFNYVDLWLRRQHKDDAVFYWRQARAFHRASQDLPIESSPLVLYYCYMNAAKALLAAKGVTFTPYHGVTAHRMRGANSKVVLSNEGIRIKNDGIVPALSGYFSEAETSKTHSLEDVLYNIVCIHRTYCLSYPNHRERFLPLKEVTFVREDLTGEVRLRALAATDVDWRAFRRALPPTFTTLSEDTPGVMSNACVTWASATSPTAAEMNQLRQLNQALRSQLHYINGAQTLWYLKIERSRGIARQPITLILIAMHRLSEICRYRPSELLSLLTGQKDWLLSEFVTMTPAQYLDEIACEITGQQIMIPNVRVPF